MAEFEIKIQKKDLWLLTVLFVFLIGVGYVIAFGGNQPSDMGHSIEEMDWSQPIPADISVDGSLRIIPRSGSNCNAAYNGAIFYDSDNDELYTCRNSIWTQVRGPQGPQGTQGPQGSQGPRGSTSTITGPDWNCVTYYSYGSCGTCAGGWVRIMCSNLNDYYNQRFWTCCPPLY